VTIAVNAPVAMNTTTATSDLADSRERPQTP
jgi:hypothetical protein